MVFLIGQDSLSISDFLATAQQQKTIQIIQEKLIEGIKKGQTHYTNAKGIEVLRESIAKTYDNKYSKEEVIVSPGVKQGMFNLFSVIEQTKVAIIEPTWLGYQAIIAMHVITLAVQAAIFPLQRHLLKY